jgi:hypothetical protein
MGTSVARMYATIYFSYHEEKNPTPRVWTQHSISLSIYQRCLHDPDSDAWKSCKTQQCIKLLWSRRKLITMGNFEPLKEYNLSRFASSNRQKNKKNYFMHVRETIGPALVDSLKFSPFSQRPGQLRQFWLQVTEEEDFILFTRKLLRFLREPGYSFEEIKLIFLIAAENLDIPQAKQQKAGTNDGTSGLFPPTVPPVPNTKTSNTRNIQKRICGNAIKMPRKMNQALKS